MGARASAPRHQRRDRAARSSTRSSSPACAITTSASTATATPTASPARRSPIVARACASSTATTPCPASGPTAGRSATEQCLAELRRCSGTQFDPAMVKAFRRALRRLEQQRASGPGPRRACRAADRPRRPRPPARARRRGAPGVRADGERPPSASRRSNPPVRFITSFSLHGGECITVLDTGETEDDVSRCGDPWLPEDELSRVLAGERLLANVLNADDYGVWVSGIAPVCDAEGRVVAAVTVDAPAVKSLRPRRSGRPLADAGGDAAGGGDQVQSRGGRSDHRRPHRSLQPPLPARAPRGGARAQPAPPERALLLFCDCDQFKTYNDDHGHKAGDAALSRIARIIEANSRRTDLAARYGGEEFVLALIDTDAAGAQAVAELIRAEVESVSARHGRPLTISVGIATSPGDAARTRRAPRQGGLGHVRGQARRAQPRARLLRRSRARRDVALPAREIGPRARGPVRLSRP